MLNDKNKHITDNGILIESVYNLVPKVSPAPPKAKRYQSIHTPKVKELYASVKQPNKTMGYAKTPLTPPSDFLKKHSKEKKLEKEIKPFEYPDKHRRKPPLPKKDVHISLREKSQDFVKENKRKMRQVPATVPEKKIVENVKGDTNSLEFSGLVPKYCTKEEFGKIPEYLKKRQEDMDYSKEMHKKFIKELREQKEPVKLKKEEINQLLEDLNNNWKALNKQYLSLPLCIDTIRRKERKIKLEEQLNIIENDIKLLQHHQEHYVYDPDIC